MMTKSKTKVDYFAMDPVEVYEMVQDGKLKRFPNYYFDKQDPETALRIQAIFLYILIDKLNFNEEDIKTNFGTYFITKKCRLSSLPCYYTIFELLSITFSNYTQDILLKYPQIEFWIFMPWELKKVSDNYWVNKDGSLNDEHAALTIDWLFNKLKWTDKDIKKKFCTDTLISNGLKHLLEACNYSPYNLLKLVKPNIMSWELKKVSNNYWTNKDGTLNKEHVTLALNWLFNKLNWSDDDIKEEFCKDTFISNDLAGLLSTYEGSCYKLLSLVRPNIMPWELKRVQQNYWVNKDGSLKKVYVIFTLNWLMKTLNLKTKEDIMNNIGLQILIDNGLINFYTACGKDIHYIKSMAISLLH